MTDPAVTAHHSAVAAFESQLDRRERVYEQPLVAVTLHCTTCGRSERSGPCFDHDDALDLMSTLGWMENPAGSDVWYCPGCTQVRADKDQLNEGRRRDNTNAARTIVARREESHR